VGQSAKEAVRAFWEAEACGERYGDRHDAVRYELEPEVEGFADFSSGRGRRVLEIGVGRGADFVRWLQAGAQATGIDFTHRAVTLTREGARQHGLGGSLNVGDAEKLPFRDGQFEVVYSWGVLHHTPDFAAALREAIRVLAPGGELRVMVYHRRSWVALAAWVRFCLLRGRPFSGLRAAVSEIESPGTQAFTRSELAALVELDDVAVVPRLTHWDRRLFPGVARLLGDRFGWFLLVRGTKRAADRAA
jgi:ubiquinone/menaquinone biosynthesis C-methylase UbiE